MLRSTDFPNLFREGHIGKLRTRNRIVMSPMMTHFGGIMGEVTQQTIDHYVARAKGGVGLIITGGTEFYPFPTSRLDTYGGGLSIAEDRYKKGLAELTEEVHAWGAKIFVQLSHSGRTQSAASLKGYQPVSSSPVPATRPGAAFPTPRALTRGEIHEFIERWAQGARRAKQAGFDGVSLHMAHGTLMTSFISPLLNQRGDEFGGSLENRMRFPMGVVSRIKELCGSDFPVDVRFSADEFKEGGVTTKDSPLIAQKFVEAGADSINVSSAFYDNLHKSNDIMRNQEGWKRYIWQAVKRGLHTPTIACGGLRHPEFCEEVLAEGDADFVGLGRSLLADPEWPLKAAQGRVEDIRHCISCLVCLQHVFATGADRCAVNPDWGRRKDFTEIKPAANTKKVMVIGGGPGGMEAARIAALRGHEVTLYDKQEKMGGQLLLAAKPPGKEKLLWVRDYEETQLKKLKVKVELGTEVTPELVESENPDVVIVATGAEPAIPEIPGIRGKNVLTVPQVLGDEIEIAGRNVIVIGGGMVGCEVGEYLADQGNKVTVVARSSMMATDMEPLNRQGLMEALGEKSVVLINNKETVEILENGITVTDKETGESLFIAGDCIVIARGSQPARTLADRLADKVDELYTTGDCNEPRAIMEAIYEGSLIARRI
ncbi:MAG: FAD-dependent oxidoreductase [Proteobacteria bacterium]|nr:FAD-dependent oxidoreductase [Pseudomonadota bacterium]